MENPTGRMEYRQIQMLSISFRYDREAAGKLSVCCFPVAHSTYKTIEFYCSPSLFRSLHGWPEFAWGEFNCYISFVFTSAVATRWLCVYVWSQEARQEVASQRTFQILLIDWLSFIYIRMILTDEKYCFFWEKKIEFLPFQFLSCHFYRSNKRRWRSQD